MGEVDKGLPLSLKKVQVGDPKSSLKMTEEDQMQIQMQMQKADAAKKLLRDDTDACLVESVRNYPVIYDANDANFRNNFRKSQAWLQVVEDLRKKGYECSETFCRKRYWALKKRFRVKKEAEELPPESSSRREKSFPLYQKMDYLHSFMTDANCSPSSLIALEDSDCSAQHQKEEPATELSINSVPRREFSNSSGCSRGNKKRRVEGREARLNQATEDTLNAESTTLVDPRWIDILNSFGYLSRELSDEGFLALKRRVVPTLSQMLATALAEDMALDQNVDGSLRVPIVTLVTKRKKT